MRRMSSFKGGKMAGYFGTRQGARAVVSTMFMFFVSLQTGWAQQAVFTSQELDNRSRFPVVFLAFISKPREHKVPLLLDREV